MRRASADAGAPPTVAWIESPFQLLSLIEAASGGMLRLPAEGHLRGDPLMYRPLNEHLERHPVEGLHLVPDARLSTARRRLRGAGELAVGDVYSGQVGWLLTTERRPGVVVLDDGSSTMTALHSLTSARGTLVRPRSADDRVRSTVGVAVHRVLRMRLPDRVRVATGLPLATSVADTGLRVDTHEFGWTRAAGVDHDIRDADVVILGSALPADGLIGRDHYHEWLDRQFDRVSRSAIYLPHRRNDGASIELVRRRGGSLASTGGLPVELICASWAQAQRVATLPSTTTFTLPVVAPGLPLECWDVPTHWWTDRATPAMRQLAAAICSFHTGLADNPANHSDRRATP